MTRDIRFVSGAELRAGMSEGDEPALIIDGRAVGYDKLSLPNVPFRGCKERIRPGAFADSLARGETVIANFNHERAYLPLGSTKNRTLILHDIASSGLHFELRLDPKVTAHRDLHQLVKNGTISECSFEFTIPDGGDDFSSLLDDEDRCSQLRSVNKAALHAITLTPQPAYAHQATFANARNFSYALGPVRRPSISSGELRARVAEIGKQIERDRLALETAERLGMNPAEHVAYLRRRAREIDELIAMENHNG